jgi:cell surface protein SprA
MGVNVEHKISDNSLGGTFLKCLKTVYSEIKFWSVSQQYYFGFNTNFSSEVPFLTRLVKLPNVDTDVPSNLSVGEK